LLLTVKAALQAFRDEASWRALMRNGMTRDFSWNASAKEYVKVYERARQAAGLDGSETREVLVKSQKIG